jgi:4,5-DOPA dioxygenase extradiol
MNAIEESEFSRGWKKAADSMPKPEAVLCVSAHWETKPTAVGAVEKPETIHDFGGFPQALFDVVYPAPGDPDLAAQVAKLVRKTMVVSDEDRGLDHGAWSVLNVMYPKADVPVVQLSLDTTKSGPFHLALAAELAPLREKGVLVLGSGNIVHNLGVFEYQKREGFDWAVRIDAELKERIKAGDNAGLADYASVDPEMALAVPTPEHYFPLLYVMALRRPDEPITLFNEKVIMGSMSMTCVQVG